MRYFLTSLTDLLFHDSKFGIQLQNLLDKPLYRSPARNGSILDPYTCFRILYDLSGSVIAASSKLCIMPDLSYPIFTECYQLIRERCLFQQFQAECTIDFPPLFFLSLFPYSPLYQIRKLDLFLYAECMEKKY